MVDRNEHYTRVHPLVLTAGQKRSVEQSGGEMVKDYLPFQDRKPAQNPDEFDNPYGTHLTTKADGNQRSGHS